MSCFSLMPPVRLRCAGIVGSTALVIAALTPVAPAQEAVSAPPRPGEVSLDLRGLPAPTVELDLGRGLIGQVLGLGDAALGGFLDGLAESDESAYAENLKYLTHQLASARELTEVAGGVVHEVHVRVWKDLPDGGEAATELIRQLEAQLAGRDWESALRVREQGKMAQVFVQQQDASIRGVLLIASQGNELATANVLGDLSEENVKRLTSVATKLGIELGLDRELNRAVENLKRERNR